MRRPLRIGLTGGIGSGKSCAVDCFRKLGVPVLDLDRVGHKVARPGSKGLTQLIEAFGSTFLNSDGSLNRTALAAYCFSDAEKTARLNGIMHPLIWEAEAVWLAQQQAPYVIIEASVLLESGGETRMDAVIVLMADEELRLQRVLARGDRDEAAFRAIVSRQCGDDRRRKAADYLVDNSGSLTALQEQLQVIHRNILAGLG